MSRSKAAQQSSKRLRKVSLARLFLVLVLFAAPSVVPDRADAQIFVTNYLTGTVGKYSLSGETINASLITGLTTPQAIAVDSSGIYVANTVLGGSVGKYSLTGESINPNLITGLSGPIALAVSGSDLFVASWSPNGNHVVGKYTTSGAMINGGFVSGLKSPTGIAVSNGALFVTSGSSNGNGGIVGKYDAATGAAIDANMITHLLAPSQIAATDSSLFVGLQGQPDIGKIGKYLQNGVAINPSLIASQNWPGGIAILGDRLFVVGNGSMSPGAGTVAEYSLSGELINTSLISGLTGPAAIAVIPEPPTYLLAAIGVSAVFAIRRRIRT